MSKKIFLELEEDEPINIGLIRQAKRLPDYEMFFEINKVNSFNFYRIDDIKYKKFSFPKFETYHPENKTCFQIIANKSVPIRKKTSNELFSQAEEIKFLMLDELDTAHRNEEIIILDERITKEMMGIQKENGKVVVNGKDLTVAIAIANQLLKYEPKMIGIDIRRKVIGV